MLLYGVRTGLVVTLTGRRMVGRGYTDVPQMLAIFSFLIRVLFTVGSVCEIHQPVHLRLVNFDANLYLNTKCFFNYTEQHLTHRTFSVSASFLSSNGSIITSTRKETPTYK